MYVWIVDLGVFKPNKYAYHLNITSTIDVLSLLVLIICVKFSKIVPQYNTIQYNTIQYNLLNSSNKRACSNRFVNENKSIDFNDSRDDILSGSYNMPAL